MYVPAYAYVGPFPLSTILLVVSLMAALAAASRLDPSQRVVELLGAIIIGAVFGDKAIYIASDPGYYIQQPSHLIFTPISTWGVMGLVIGGLIGLGWAYRNHRGQWSRGDLDIVGLALVIMLVIRGPGQNLLGVKIPSLLATLAVKSGAAAQFPSYALWTLMLLVVGGIGVLLYRRFHQSHPGVTAGLLTLGIALAWLVTSLTLPQPTVPFTVAQWVALIGAAVGFRLSTPTATFQGQHHGQDNDSGPQS